jgi:hypothetical protein
MVQNHGSWSLGWATIREIIFTCVVWTYLDLCLALMAFSRKGSCTCHTCCKMGPLF